MCNIGGTERITEHMSHGQWVSMVSTIRDLDSSLVPNEGRDIDMRDTKQIILHGNLSVGTKRMSNRRTAVTARSSSQLESLRRYFGPTFGCGVRKGSPSHKDTNAGRGTVSLQEAGIVNIVDCDLSGFEEEATNGNWIFTHASHQHTYFKGARNFIRMKFDHRLRTITLVSKLLLWM